jgi:hypothetical protein
LLVSIPSSRDVAPHGINNNLVHPVTAVLKSVVSDKLNFLSHHKNNQNVGLPFGQTHTLNPALIHLII